VFLFISFQSLTATGAAGTGKIAYEVAKNLSEKKYPVKLVVSSTGKFKTNFLSVPVSFFSRYYLFILNRVISPFLKPYQKRYLEELIFDFFCCSQIQSDQKIVFSTTPFIPRTFKKAKKLGIPIVFFPGTPEENHIEEIVKSEMNRWSVSTPDVYTYKPRLEIFNRGVSLTDAIICHSSIIKSTFSNHWKTKKIISCFGLLKPALESIAQSRPTSFKVVYIAHTVLLKGLQYLLKAWNDLKAEGELVILGGIDPAVQQIIDREFSSLKHVKFVGPTSNVDPYLHDASVLVCPSLIDGGPVTVLEAMRCGVPSILTDACGIQDMIQHQTTGWIVQAAHAEALTSRLQWCYQNAQEVSRVGQNGRQALSQYDFNAFIENIAAETLALQKI
jgi:glycosyltransferase involved in cell wall biosynthesis